MGKSSPNQPYEQHHAVDAKTPVVTFSQMLAAGLASVGAATVTSRFGVAGTIIGAALTTMIITGGSAILRSYLETLSGRVKGVPEKLRTSRLRQRSGRTEEQPLAPEEPTQAVETRRTRQGFFGRFRSALDWFRGLPSRGKRTILIGAAVPTVIAFVIAIGAVTGVELLGGKTLSCMVWGDCYVAADGSGGPRTSFGVLSSGSNNVQRVQPADELQDPSAQPVVPGAEEQQPAEDGGFFSGGDEQEDEQIVPEQPVESQPEVPEEQVVPEEPVEPQQPVVPEQPVESQPVPEEAAPVTPTQ